MATARSIPHRSLGVLAALWFFPVSCTIATGVGTNVLAALDERDAARGDKVHSSIAVVVLPPPAPERAFGYLLLGNLSRYKEQHPEANFLMPAAQGKITVDTSIDVSYQVVAGSGTGEQTIETQYKDGDRAAWGRYRATRNDITPLASRLFAADYMFAMIPWALGFAFVVFIGARLAQRRMRKDGGT